MCDNWNCGNIVDGICYRDKLKEKAVCKDLGVCPLCNVDLVDDKFGNIFCPICHFIENDNTV